MTPRGKVLNEGNLEKKSPYLKQGIEHKSDCSPSTEAAQPASRAVWDSPRLRLTEVPVSYIRKFSFGGQESSIRPHVGHVSSECAKVRVVSDVREVIEPRSTCVVEVLRVVQGAILACKFGDPDRGHITVSGADLTDMARQAFEIAILYSRLDSVV